jgi:hypothetical protein
VDPTHGAENEPESADIDATYARFVARYSEPDVVAHALEHVKARAKRRAKDEDRQEYGTRRAGSVPQPLHSEDRQEYERILDEALRSAPLRPELAVVGRRLNPEQLRTMALNATVPITAAAATEYEYYVKVREELRQSASSTRSTVRETGSTESDGAAAMGLATPLGEGAEGAGALAVAAVLTPVLAGTVAAIFLLVGFVLKVLVPKSVFAHVLITIGWVSGTVTAAAILVAIVGLLLTALRNRPSLDTGPYGESGGEVARARDAWHDALLERGILPFLQEALAAPGTAPPAPSRMPLVGYDRPGFSSPDDGPEPGHRPRFSSPDFSSPDFGGPEHQPE